MNAIVPVVITRDSNETVNGVRREGRVFITGPHFGGDIYSSTTDRTQASRFERREAERLLALGKWRGNDPRIEEVAP
jgi:hypothetical protein